MARASKITISLPNELIAAADARLAREGEGRSGMLRRLIEEALREVEEREKVESYIRAYREQPQTQEESGWHDAANLEIAAELPWQE
ncbi:MAG: hypothetical protein HY675_08305 [Chloroflexi bacterium]|nr:hypothetical protein [Chloroflexota bacterium]